ncbi:hypothetical protein [Kitasatospora sp. GP82]|uniref:hypothetical protein n=1 Tax=Kitasatospora sp. GP82 TaxID=3035089 RepID=UPI00247577E6|nr:hypothetical protein [Kitasatospora sp. GP82]MDH6129804.1 hypothetical protein [Kitasatospora sp. GP82]
MIRADRRDLARTVAELADDWQMSLPMFRKKKIHQAPGFPSPVTSAPVKPTLWDGGQTDAYRAGREIPELGPAGPSDLLDRYEVAALLHIDVRSWDKYHSDLYAPGNTAGLPEVPASVDVCGVLHWPKGPVQEWDALRSGGGAGGRPLGSVDLIPREEIRPRAAALLAGNPRTTAEALARALGIHPETAREVLAVVRTEVIARHVLEHGEEQAELVQEQTGVPVWALSRLLPDALDRVAEQNLRAVRVYGEAVCRKVTGGTDRLRWSAGVGGLGQLAIDLPSPAADRPAVLLWDARWGWATALDVGEAAAFRSSADDLSVDSPESDGLRYRGSRLVPAPAEVEAALGGRGRARPARTAVTPQRLREVAALLAGYLPGEERIGAYLPS